MLHQMLEPDFSFTDERGKLIQLVHCGYEQINVLQTKAGVTRGGHYHKLRKEAFFVVQGSVRVELQKEDVSELLDFKEGDFFSISPFVVHSMFFPEDCTMIAMYDGCIEMEDGSRDIYRP